MSCFPVRKKTTNEPATPLAVEIAAASSSVEQSSKLQQTSSESVVPPPPPPQMEQQEARQPILLVTKAPLNIPKIEEEKKLEYRFREKGLTTEEFESLIAKSRDKVSPSMKLGGNRFESIPDSVLAMSDSLQELSMPKNELEGELNFQGLRVLTKLYIMDNPRIQRLPGLPISLTVFCAGNIGLEKLDASILELTELRTLSLPGNKLQGIPEGISRLKNLVEFDLSKNLFWRVPLELRELVIHAKLDSLCLQGNPLPGPLRRNIVMQHKMLDFFDQTVVVYETFLVLFMCWTRLRTNPSGEVDLGCLPRDCLNEISRCVADNSAHERAPSSIKRKDRVARPKLADAAYGLI